jgi:uncharacterized protein (TIGR00251 family)
MSQVIGVRVTPRSSKPGIGGWRTGADGREELEVRVAEAPADGAANDAVVRLLAKSLGLAPSDVTIAAGQASRHKRVALPLDLGEVRRRIGQGQQR